MKGDVSRLTYRREKHYERLLKQQGRVDLDADWNEFVEILGYLRKIGARDVIGKAGAPRDHGGFKVGIAANLRAVHFPTAAAGYAVGDDGLALATMDGGSTWAPLTAPSPVTLRAVHFVSAGEGWVVGDRGTILRRAGGSWTAQSGPTSVTLRGVHFVSASTGWVVGDGATILKTTDGGATWVPQSPPEAVVADLLGVFFVSATKGWAVGAHGTIITTSDGTAWSRESPPADVSSDLRSVRFASASVGYAVGGDGTLLRRDGAGWTRETTTATYSSVGLWSVFAKTATEAWTVGDGGTVLRRTSATPQWTPQTSGSGARLLGVHIVSTSAGDTGHVVGDAATVLRTTDGGANWATTTLDPIHTLALTLSPGRIYVDGILAENEDGVTYRNQPEFPSPPPYPAPTGAASRRDLVLLDVWHRHVTAVEDPHIRDPALGGPDTATRAMVVWQVRVLPDVDATNCFARETKYPPPPSRGRLSCRVAPTPTLPDPCLIPPSGGYRGLENRMYRVEIHDGGEPYVWPRPRAANVAATAANGFRGYAAATLLPPEDAEVRSVQVGLLELDGRPWLPGQVVEVFSDGLDASEVPGRLARIEEVTAPGTTATLRVDVDLSGISGDVRVRRVATYKVSRDNGSVVFEVEEFPPAGLGEGKVRVKRFRRDQVVALRQGDWVEVLDDATELLGLPGTLAQITAQPDEAQRVITLSKSLSGYSRERHPKVRRWDQDEDARPVTDEPVHLEDGVEIRFTGGRLQTGDFWSFAARTATGEVDPRLREARPMGIRHHYARLAHVTWEFDTTAGRWGAIVRDCRPVFLPLTEQGACCTVTVGDGVMSFGQFNGPTGIQDAIDYIYAEAGRGGIVCVLRGDYELPHPVAIANREDLIVVGAGRATRVSARRDPTAFRVEDSTGVSIGRMLVRVRSPAASPSPPAGAVHVLRSNRVEVRDCALVRQGRGANGAGVIAGTASAPPASGLSIVGNEISAGSDGGSGIMVLGPFRGVSILGNEVVAPDNAGEAGVRGRGTLVHWVIDGTRVRGMRVGFDLQSVTSESEDIVIERNEAVGTPSGTVRAGSVGIQLIEEPGVGRWGDHVLIRDTRLARFERGVVFRDPASNSGELAGDLNRQIEGCTLEGITGTGMRVEGASVVVRRNAVHVVGAEGFGVDVEGIRSEISGNQLRAITPSTSFAQAGIRVATGSHDSVVHGNRFLGAFRIGVVLQKIGTPTTLDRVRISDNLILGAATSGVSTVPSAATAPGFSLEDLVVRGNVITTLGEAPPTAVGPLSGGIVLSANGGRVAIEGNLVRGLLDGSAAVGDGISLRGAWASHIGVRANLVETFEHGVVFSDTTTVSISPPAGRSIRGNTVVDIADVGLGVEGAHVSVEGNAVTVTGTGGFVLDLRCPKSIVAGNVLRAQAGPSSAGIRVASGLEGLSILRNRIEGVMTRGIVLWKPGTDILLERVHIEDNEVLGGTVAGIGEDPLTSAGLHLAGLRVQRNRISGEDATPAYGAVVLHAGGEHVAIDGNVLEGPSGTGPGVLLDGAWVGRVSVAANRITGFGEGVIVGNSAASGTPLDQLTGSVERNVLEAITTAGVRLETRAVDVIANTIQLVGEGGFAIDLHGGDCDIAKNVVRTLPEGSFGAIRIQAGSSNVAARSNRILGGYGTGILLGTHDAPVGVHGILVEHNEIRDLTESGITTSNPPSSGVAGAFDDIRIEHNRLADCPQFPEPTGTTQGPIVLRGLGSGLRVAGNHIADPRGAGRGIVIWGSWAEHLLVEDNVLSRCTTAIYLEDPFNLMPVEPTGNASRRVEGNTLRRVLGTGMDVRADGIHIARNSMHVAGPGGYGLSLIGSFCEVVDNDIKGAPSTEGGGPRAAIRLASSSASLSTHVLVRGNRILGGSGMGIMLGLSGEDQRFGTLDDISIVDNEILGMESSGISVEELLPIVISTDRLVVEGNVIDGCGSEPQGSPTDVYGGIILRSGSTIRLSNNRIRLVPRTIPLVGILLVESRGSVFSGNVVVEGRGTATTSAGFSGGIVVVASGGGEHTPNVLLDGNRVLTRTGVACAILGTGDVQAVGNDFAFVGDLAPVTNLGRVTGGATGAGVLRAGTRAEMVVDTTGYAVEAVSEMSVTDFVATYRPDPHLLAAAWVPFLRPLSVLIFGSNRVIFSDNRCSGELAASSTDTYDANVIVRAARITFVGNQCVAPGKRPRYANALLWPERVGTANSNHCTERKSASETLSAAREPDIVTSGTYEGLIAVSVSGSGVLPGKVSADFLHAFTTPRPTLRSVLVNDQDLGYRLFGGVPDAQPNTHSYDIPLAFDSPVRLRFVHPPPNLTSVYRITVNPQVSLLLVGPRNGTAIGNTTTHGTLVLTPAASSVNQFNILEV